MGVEDIASELKIPLTQVKNFIEGLRTEDEKIAPAKTDKTKDLMIRQTSAKKNNTVSIMTQAAAQLSDDFVKSVNPNTSKNTDSYIFRPRS